MTVYESTSRGAPPQGPCILMNICRLLKFSTQHSASHHGIHQQIMSNESSLYMTQLEGKEANNFQQVSRLIELKSIPST